MAPTAEELMRSRFSAFAVGDIEYLLASWHTSTRPTELRLNPQQRWTRLEILSASGGSVFETSGLVEFRAHFKQRGAVGILHERSRFLREDGHWYYLNGVDVFVPLAGTPRGLLR